MGDTDLHDDTVSGVVDVDFALLKDAGVVGELELRGGGDGSGAGLML